MSYIERDRLQVAPFTGEFYDSVIDETLPLDEQVETKKTICTVSCDIQQDGHAQHGTSLASVYKVYVPFDTDGNIPVERGNLFSGAQYGRTISGKVVGVFASQLGGWIAYVETYEV